MREDDPDAVKAYEKFLANRRETRASRGKPVATTEPKVDDEAKEQEEDVDDTLAVTMAARRAARCL